MAYPELAGGGGPVLEKLGRVLEDDFFGAVEITRVNDKKLRREARAMLDGAGVDVIFAGQPAILGDKLDLNAADLSERKRAVKACQGLVDQAYELGARIMMVMSGPDPGEPEREAARERFANSLKQLCQYTGERADEYLLAVCSGELRPHYQQTVPDRPHEGSSARDRRRAHGAQQLRPDAGP